MLVTALSVAIATGASAAAQASPLWGSWSPPAAQYPGVVVQENVPITMSDGVVLFANIVAPADASSNQAPGQFPVLLTITPYNKDLGNGKLKGGGGLGAAEDDYLVEHGYIQVIVDARGTGSSEGQWDALGTREQQDGAELVKWSAEQPWSDGSVGMHGKSYMAINQLLTAASQPPALKSIFPIVPSADVYRDLFLQGGQVDTEFAALWFGLVTGSSSVPAKYATSDPGEAGKVLLDHAGSAVSYTAAQTASATTGGDAAYDGPFYQSRSPIDSITKVKVPTFIVGGWFDLFQRGEPLLFQALQQQGTPVHLLMGPWYHNTAGGSPLPDTANNIPGLDDMELRWDDHYVKGLPDPALDDGSAIPPITYYENGSGQWRSASAWYAPGVSYQALHLGGAATPATPGSLSWSQPTPSAPDTLAWNPTTGACTRSTGQWTAGEGVGTPCDTDNRGGDAGGISYRLPITSSLHLLGPITAHLYVSSLQGRDGQLTARVEDVSPSGQATQISAGWQVLSMRALDPTKTVSQNGLITQPFHPFTQASVQAMPSDNSPVEVDVEIFPSSWALNAGDTLQLTLQTADEPHLTATAPQTSNSAGGVLSIYHDAAHDSELDLPVAAG
jgi:putative CocE/NonD family hydrolase